MTMTLRPIGSRQLEERSDANPRAHNVEVERTERGELISRITYPKGTYRGVLDEQGGAIAWNLDVASGSQPTMWLRVGFDSGGKCDSINDAMAGAGCVGGKWAGLGGGAVEEPSQN